MHDLGTSKFGTIFEEKVVLLLGHWNWRLGVSFAKPESCNFFVNSTVKPWKSSRYDTLHLSIWPIFELVQWLQLPMSHQSYFLSMVYRLQEDMTENLITGFSFIFRSLQVSLSSFRSLKFTMKSLRFQGKQTMHHFDTENILPWHFPLTSIYTTNYNN